MSKCLTVFLFVSGIVSMRELRAQPAADRARAQELLSTHCLSCHGSARLSGLDLRTREAALHGGTRGPAVKPGDAEQSLLYQAVAHTAAFKMPPGKPALPRQDVETIKRWIAGGAE